MLNTPSPLWECVTESFSVCLYPGALILVKCGLTGFGVPAQTLASVTLYEREVVVRRDGGVYRSFRFSDQTECKEFASAVMHAWALALGSAF